jgi:hypothetical protein
MKTLLVPKFKAVWSVGKKRHTYEFDKYVKVKIKNNPDSADYVKVIRYLPGIQQGYVPEFYTITKTLKPIEITDFYDIRQNAKILKGFYISVLH